MINGEIRPWGYYENIFEAPGFKVKHICVSPKCRLSLQTHESRSEHWVITKGKGIVQVGHDTHTLNKNQLPCSYPNFPTS